MLLENEVAESRTKSADLVTLKRYLSTYTNGNNVMKFPAKGFELKVFS